jgi:hypothetical protein
MTVLRTQQVRQEIRAFRNFRIASLSGRQYGQGNAIGVDPGRLAGDDLAAFRKAQDAMIYIIFSFGTPIAWEAQGRKHIVTQKFSVTTSGHQNIVRGLWR